MRFDDKVIDRYSEKNFYSSCTSNLPSQSLSYSATMDYVDTYILFIFTFFMFFFYFDAYNFMRKWKHLSAENSENRVNFFSQESSFIIITFYSLQQDKTSFTTFFILLLMNQFPRFFYSLNHSLLDFRSANYR